MEVLKYVAFSTTPAGGNPAGVMLDATGVDDATMAKIAEHVGFSETAFVVPRPDGGLDVRYFSPLIEVPFCGHATIAAAVAHASRRGPGELLMHTKAGPIRVDTAVNAEGLMCATLVSVPPKTAPIPSSELSGLLAALKWSAAELDPALPPRAAYAGVWHPVIAARTRSRLAELDYEMPVLAEVMRRNDWATVDLVWRESPEVFHARNPFPPGGVVEDPATGAAAAALGGYLRELGLVEVPGTVTVHQGHDMGRPSTITVSIPESPDSGISVTGTAVPL
ncbi:PhzF family phenazine biosynthesis protein [Nonomuraea sp. KM90]|uniref:PhzF family phenazine biosynthesis protein n=1 Tax=Nonomuraea sp. KM90 TaxID=3457428 RepID=UPI003FCCC184